MADDLKAILQRLDNSDDSLFTQEGEVTIAAASAVAGRKVTREQIRDTGVVRGQARESEKQALTDYALELAKAELATAERVAAIAAIERHLKAARVALGESYAKYIRHQKPISVEDSIREHLKRCRAHELAGNVAAPAVVQHQSALDSLMANGGRRGSAKPRGLLR